MANYPSYGILLESKQTYEPSWRDDISDAGQLHSRQMRSTDYIRFDIMHSMTTAEFRALRSTYAAGPRDTYTLSYHDESPAVTYSVTFIAPPQITRNLGGGRHKVKVALRGTQD